MPDPELQKLEKLQKILEAADTDYATSQEVAEVIADVLLAVESVSTDLQTTVAAAQKSAESGDATLSKRIDATDAKLDTTAADLRQAIETIALTPGDDGKDADEEAIIAAVLAKVEIPPPEKGDDGSPDTAEDIRNKLELLDGEERLDAKYIKNLPEIVEKAGIVMGANRNFYQLLDVDMSGITVGQSAKWDGIRWIPYTPTGGAGTSVYNEVPSGSGTTFNLAHTPLAGTLRLYRGGARQQLTGDYTLSGATITFLIAVSAGEVLESDYIY